MEQLSCWSSHVNRSVLQTATTQRLSVRAEAAPQRLPIDLLDQSLAATPEQLWDELWAQDAAGILRWHRELADHSITNAPWQEAGATPGVGVRPGRVACDGILHCRLGAGSPAPLAPVSAVCRWEVGDHHQLHHAPEQSLPQAVSQHRGCVPRLALRGGVCHPNALRQSRSTARMQCATWLVLGCRGSNSRFLASARPPRYAFSAPVLACRSPSRVHLPTTSSGWHAKASPAKPGSKSLVSCGWWGSWLSGTHADSEASSDLSCAGLPRSVACLSGAPHRPP